MVPVQILHQQIVPVQNLHRSVRVTLVKSLYRFQDGVNVHLEQNLRFYAIHLSQHSANCLHCAGAVL